MAPKKDYEEEAFKKIHAKFGKASQTLIKEFHELYRKVDSKSRSHLYYVSSENFIKDCANIIEESYNQGKYQIIVTFDLRTRDLAFNLKDRGIDLEEWLHFVDCISYATGHGAPPVFNLFCLNQPDEFENIFYYTIMHLLKLYPENTTVSVISPSTFLNYSNYNDVGVFFHWFIEKLNERGINVNLLYREDADNILHDILQREVG
ncbi:hypothetical protein GOV09_04425 [Candidatus Woesearchaeota archaeon]|nr:hypothetical protein [Candidatus Woesearchaeota archaeon]